MAKDKASNALIACLQRAGPPRFPSLALATALAAAGLGVLVAVGLAAAALLLPLGLLLGWL